MNEILKGALLAIAGNGAIIALILWITKKAFSNLLEKNISRFTKALDLSNQKGFHKFSKMYDEQAEIVKDTYGKLVQMIDKVEYLAYHFNLLEVHPEYFEDYRRPKDGDPAKWDKYLKRALSEKDENVKAEELTKQASEVLTQFMQKRIFFPKLLAAEIQKLMVLILYIASQFRNVTYRDAIDFKPTIAEEVIETWKKAVKASRDLLPKIEEIFRKGLGIDEKENA